MVPPLPESASATPFASTAASLLIGIESDPLAVDVIAAVTTATTPLPIVPEFVLKAIHVTIPADGLQVTPLPADVNAGPADTVRDPILAAE